MLTAVVADDEALARRRVVRLIEETRSAEVVAACAGGRETVERTIALQPDVLFLDVQMPDLDGFGVVEAMMGRASPAIVFVTAFDRYAVRAFDVHAVDYLLKPFDTARFRAAFERAAARADAARPPAARLADDDRVRAAIAEYLANTRDAAAPYLDRVGVKSNGVLKVVRTADIDWWETDGNYVQLHVGSTSHLMRTTLAAIEPQLDPRMFIRVHRRIIVNVERIVEVQPWFAGDAVLVLRGGTKLRLSRTHRERLHARLGQRTGSEGEMP
jgi:two-component system LytT family response regulator